MKELNAIDMEMIIIGVEWNLREKNYDLFIRIGFQNDDKILKGSLKKL
jgi:hypothetical protein